MVQEHTIIGVWRVTVKGAPTPYHMFVFHADGTMQQSNPPAGNTETSDTAGMGVWTQRAGLVKARFEEFRLDLADGTTTRGVIDFDLKVADDTLTGSCTFNVYEAESDILVHGPHPATLKGHRVTLN